MSKKQLLKISLDADRLFTLISTVKVSLNGFQQALELTEQRLKRMRKTIREMKREE